MRTRHKRLSDYGISYERGIVLYDKCRRGTTEEQVLLTQAAIKICGAVLGQKIVESLIHGKSYDTLSRESYIPIGKNDFYGYRRKTLALFDKYLKGME